VLLIVVQQARFVGVDVPDGDPCHRDLGCGHGVVQEPSFPAKHVAVARLLWHLTHVIHEPSLLQGLDWIFIEVGVEIAHHHHVLVGRLDLQLFNEA